MGRISRGIIAKRKIEQHTAICECPRTQRNVQPLCTDPDQHITPFKCPLSYFTRLRPTLRRIVIRTVVIPPPPEIKQSSAMRKRKVRYCPDMIADHALLRRIQADGLPLPLNRESGIRCREMRLRCGRNRASRCDGETQSLHQSGAAPRLPRYSKKCSICATSFSRAMTLPAAWRCLHMESYSSCVPVLTPSGIAGFQSFGTDAQGS